MDTSTSSYFNKFNETVESPTSYAGNFKSGARLYDFVLHKIVGKMSVDLTVGIHITQ